MINKDIKHLLTEQIHMEFEAHFFYKGAGDALYLQTYVNLAQWMYEHSQEEYTHAQKIIDYLRAHNESIPYHDIHIPPFLYNSIPHIFETAYLHEVKVTESLIALKIAAEKYKDLTTATFLDWFMEEQLEEEHVTHIIAQQVKIATEERNMMLYDNTFSSKNILTKVF